VRFWVEYASLQLQVKLFYELLNQRSTHPRIAMGKVIQIDGVKRLTDLTESTKVRTPSRAARRDVPGR
jgi:hypothetical protein